MKIEKNDYDVIYPYAIKDAWCGTIHCTEEDLIKLKKEIEKILDKWHLMCYNNNGEGKISSEYLTKGVTTLVCRFGDYLTKNKS